MRSNPSDEALRWIKQARADLGAARDNYDGENHNIACFLAQQAAEKALKAYFYAQGEEYVLGHSVQELCKKAAGEDEAFDPLITMAQKLDRFYIPTRYPNGLPGGIPAESFDEDDAESAIGQAEKILTAVEKQLHIFGGIQ